MRCIEFRHASAPLLAGSKTVTRRKGWKKLKPGTEMMAGRAHRGVRREGREDFGVILVKSVRRVRLGDIDAAEVALEGYPELTPAEFLARFFKGVNPDAVVTRIEFRRVGDWGQAG